MMKKILFVCLGNICRSSTAEGVMLHLIKEAGLEKEFVIDSAGILSYHQGELPDSRMRAHAARRGYQLVHRSRPVRTEDFYNFDLIIGMDDQNIDGLKAHAMTTEEEKQIFRMTDFCRNVRQIMCLIRTTVAIRASSMSLIFLKMPAEVCLMT